MNRKIILLAMLFALLLFPLATSVAVSIAVPSFNNVSTFLVATSGFSILVGGGGDEMDGLVFPG